MLRVWRRKVLWLLITAALCSLLFTIARAEEPTNENTGIVFVQLTDPHIFDGKDDASENKAAFLRCIQAINDQIENDHVDYKFIVVTGDLGLEGLISGGGVDARVSQKASELAEMLSSSRVKDWYFLPGNNDLYDELPYTIGLYRQFIRELDKSLDDLWKAKPSSGKRVTAKDLCPRDDDPDLGQKSGVFQIDSFVFIGFNNASFKNNNSFSRAGTNAVEQKHYVDQVIDRLPPDDGKSFAYIFYHIPEVDDPQWVSLKRKADANPTPNPTPAEIKKWNQRAEEFKRNSDPQFQQKYLYSAWLVTDGVRNLWGKVVRDIRVKGLLAGHFHDSDRSTYRGQDKDKRFGWMETTDYPIGSTAKLWVCPPIAAKFQSDKNGTDTARGFQKVVIAGNGNVNTTIYWYEVNRNIVEDKITAIVWPNPRPSFSRTMDIVELSVSSLILLVVMLGGIWISFRPLVKSSRP